MVDLAKQAYDTHNFDLAAEIYERFLAQNGPNVDAILGLADTLARGRRLGEAWDAYIQAFRLRDIPYSRLDNLVTAMVDFMAEKMEDVKNRTFRDPFACGSCMGLWDDPVTIQCGHTYCRPCLDKLDGNRCKLCNQVSRLRFRTLKTNVLLAQTTESWFPNEQTAVRLKAKGNTLCCQGQYEDAVRVYTQAHKLALTDHLLLANRSYAYASMNQYTKALDDAERCVALRPEWPKGYFRKASALAGLVRHEEACIAYLQCLSLDSTIGEARTAVTQSLHKALSPGTADDVKRVELHQRLHPNPLLFLQSGPTKPAANLSDSTFNMALHSIKSTYSSSGYTQFGPMQTTASSTNQQTPVENPADHQINRPIVKCSSEPCLAERLARTSCTSSTSASTTTSSSRYSPLASSSSCNSCDKLSPSTSRKRSNTGISDDASLSTSPPEYRGGKASCCGSPDCLDESGHAAHSPQAALKLPPTKHPKHSASSIGNFYQRHKTAEDASTGSMLFTAPSANYACCNDTADMLKDANSPRSVPREALVLDSFECSLCMRLLFEAVTTPCGHTFCRICLDRCLDHTPSCPLCKSSLAEYLAERRSSVNEAVTGILQMYFPKEFTERNRIHEEEIAELNKGEEIPVFVCTMAYPRIPCPLHVFEPRYRLMIRQCMESGLRQFGMVICLDQNEDSYSDYGTMLEIRDVQYFPDGRSIVDCIGGRRFKVKSRGHKNGYHTAKVEFLTDQQVTEEQLPELTNLHTQVQTLANQWFTSLPDAVSGRIKAHFGPFPALEPNALALPSGPAWHWWLVAVLPLDPRAQLAILAMSSLKERLNAIKRVIRHISSRQQQV